jgi:pimeloyl-ACP methyl ester carboxylesterase
MHYFRSGRGRPLLLLHGLGGNWRSWSPILGHLTAYRDVIAPDLPGFGETPQLSGPTSIPALVDAVVDFLDRHRLIGVDAVGSSLGGRLVLELARRHAVGTTVALDPGGFWTRSQRHVFYVSTAAWAWLARHLRPMLPLLTSDAVMRTLFFSHLSVRPWRLSPLLLRDQLGAMAAPGFDEILRQTTYTEPPRGLAARAMNAPIIIGWGRKDRICSPSEAQRALALFPGAHVYWFEDSGHYPMWDVPAETIRLILASTGGIDLVEAHAKAPSPRSTPTHLALAHA